MIAYLKGILVQKSPNEVIVDTGGVGYSAAIPLSTFIKIGDVGEAVELHIYTHLTGDSLSLFGFISTGEKDMFLRLIGISGIGPRLAINILSGIDPKDLESAVRKSDIARISLVPGIGKKTALRITMELQDKLEKKEKLISGRQRPEHEDLVSALMNMGFRRKEVEQTVNRVLGSARPDAGFEKLLRESLKRLAKI